MNERNQVISWLLDQCDQKNQIIANLTEQLKNLQSSQTQAPTK